MHDTAPAADQIETIKSKIQELLKERINVLYDEASFVGADMEALLSRLTRRGHLARVDDLRSGKWYRAAAEVRMLQDVYNFICETTGTPQVPIFPHNEDDVTAGGDGDEAASDEE